MTDCGFTKENKWFRYKACAIIIENGSVLFAGNSAADYFYPVGGAVHVGETAENAVIREVYEETGVQYEIDRPAVIHENFFSGDAEPLNGLDCHEISLYFLMKPRGTRELHSNSYTYGGLKENMYWIPVDELGKFRAYPSFLKEYLSREHNGIEHIITDERASDPCGGQPV